MMPQNSIWFLLLLFLKLQCYLKLATSFFGLKAFLSFLFQDTPRSGSGRHKRWDPFYYPGTQVLSALASLVMCQEKEQRLRWETAVGVINYKSKLPLKFSKDLFFWCVSVIFFTPQCCSVHASMAHKKMTVDDWTVADRTLNLDTLFITSLQLEKLWSFNVCFSLIKIALAFIKGPSNKKKKNREHEIVFVAFFHLLPLYCSINQIVVMF